jgi:hypothetical protein
METRLDRVGNHLESKKPAGAAVRIRTAAPQLIFNSNVHVGTLDEAPAYKECDRSSKKEVNNMSYEEEYIRKFNEMVGPRDFLEEARQHGIKKDYWPENPYVEGSSSWHAYEGDMEGAKNKKRLEEIHEEGQKAWRKDRRQLIANPYPEKSEEHMSWKCGWIYENSEWKADPNNPYDPILQEEEYQAYEKGYNNRYKPPSCHYCGREY